MDVYHEHLALYSVKDIWPDLLSKIHARDKRVNTLLHQFSDEVDMTYNGVCNTYSDFLKRTNSWPYCDRRAGPIEKVK